MEFRRLGRSGLLVSDICFGTMTFGSTVDEALSLRLMDRAHDAGVNFYDTAEMYAVPPRAETYGASEEILGKWLSRKPAVQRGVAVPKPPEVLDDTTAEELVKSGRSLVTR